MATKPWVDPIVEEVREWRRQLLEEAGGDIDALCHRLIEERKQRGEPLTSGREVISLEELQKRIRAARERLGIEDGRST